MNRVYILCVLAIGFFAFAVDLSGGVLQAKNISDSHMTLEWQPIASATKYRIFYDESDLLDPKNPEPLLDSEFFTTNTGEIQDMTPATSYTLLVRGYTEDGREVGETLPLHAKTYAAIAPMSLVGNPFTIDEKTLEIGFSRVIDTKRFEIVVKDINTNKTLSVSEVKTSPDDLRTLLVTLETTFELSHTYELTLKKVFSLDGIELPAENRIPLKILYGGSLPPVASDAIPPGASSTTIPAPLIEPDPVETLKEPVSIDKLPQTGPQDFIILVLITFLLALLLQKKFARQ